MILRMAGLLMACASVLGRPAPSNAQVTVERVDERWTLVRDGEPYHIRGAGGVSDLERLAEAGGNSIRVWGEDHLEPREWPDGRIASLMDVAYENGLTVCAGFWVQHPPGASQRSEFDYDDPERVQGQLERARAYAEKWKDHPALLLWGVGNEALGADIVRSLKEIDRVAAVFKEIDPDHPTMTVLQTVWPGVAAAFEEHCPHVDILGVNAYAGLPLYPQELERQGFTGAYIVCEYGMFGQWEGARTDWGAEVEQTSSGKARTQREYHRAAISGQPDRCLGGYAFYWGHKQECTDTWFGLFLRTGEKTERVDVLTRLWTGREPKNRSPRIDDIECAFSLRRMGAGETAVATVRAWDDDGDELRYLWVVRRESSDKGKGGVSERSPEDVEGAVVADGGARATIRTPDEPGAYRLFVYVYDGKGAAATANMPFLVESD